MLLLVFPKDDIQKGYFPYLFYTAENENYVGTLPAKRFYAAEQLSVEERPEFDTWYDAEKAKYDADPEKVFDLQAEMLKYCISVSSYSKRAAIFLEKVARLSQG